jgi:choline dehydrogenase-like flavoprotein
LSQENFDLIIVGTGFAASFFLHKVLQQGRLRKILVLERGAHHAHSWQLENQKNSTVVSSTLFKTSGLHDKRWAFTIGFGGSSSCWFACTPRMLPNDFRLNSKYGKGRDWPVSYEELEPYYAEVEGIMQVSGPVDWSLSHRSSAYPQPPHQFNEIDKCLKAAFPTTYYEQPTARARVATKNRSPCCGASTCSLCPVGAKFKIDNEMMDLYRDPRVTLQLESEVDSLVLGSNAVTSLIYKNHNGEKKTVTADAYALAANAVFNPAILLRSGDTNNFVGRYLSEQMGVKVSADVKGLRNLTGSTAINGLGYMFYDGDHRRSHGACMVESHNSLEAYRLQYKRWQERATFTFVCEDIPSFDNRVVVDGDGVPELVFSEYSEYGLAAIRKIPEYIKTMAEALPVEEVFFDPRYNKFGLPRPTEAHVLGTAVMGSSAEDSVVDKNLIHHQYRNLFVLGGSAFPTAAPANPTLTISALSLRSAEALG